MNDTACAHRATNTLQNEIDEVIIAVSDLQNLNYIQQLVLSERMQGSSDRDALFTLHYAFRDRLEALHKCCGILSEAYSTQKPAGTIQEYPETGVAHPQLKNVPLPQ